MTSKSDTARRGTLRRLIRNPLGAIAIAILAVIVLVAVLAPWITPHDPAQLQLDQINTGPNGTFWLGGDGSGRDILSRLIAASRLTLLGTLIVALVALVTGVGGGLAAGFLGGRVDAVLNWLYNIILAVPSIIMLVALFAVIGPNMAATMAVFGVLVSPILFRLVRTMVMAVRQELYVDAARVSGLSETRIAVRHVLSAVRAPIIVATAGVAGAGIVIQAGLEFLGLGNPAVPTWGGMLQNAFLNQFRAPLNILWPGLAIGLTTGALALLANALRDALEESGPTPKPIRRNRAEVVYRAPDDAVAAEPVGDALLVVSGLAVGYPTASGEPKVVVDGVSLNVRRGEVLGLVGESGSGKTQTALAVLGLLPATGTILTGTIDFDGVDLTGLGERELAPLRGRRIAYVPQEPMSNLDPCYTIGHQLAVPMRRLLGLSRGEAKARAIELLDRVGIADPAQVYRRYPHELSGGMAQRVLIASAVSCNPDLIIADEPTTALDVTVQAEILDLLRDLQAERGLSMLLVTHNFGVVADLCDRVAVMQHGRIVETADALALFDNPQHPYTRQLLASSLEPAAECPDAAAAPTGGANHG